MKTFKDKVLYVQNVISGTGAANWRQVFMADITDPGSPKIHHGRFRHRGQLFSQELLMRLRNGTEHEPVPGQPQQYNITTFSVNDLPFAASQQNEGHVGRLDTPFLPFP